MIYKLHANCLIVKGAQRSTISDLQTRQIYHISNAIAELFEDNCYLDLKKIDTDLHSSFLKFLEAEDLIIKLDDISEVTSFPQLSLEWHFPGEISNSIIDFNQHTELEISMYCDFISDVVEMGCKYLIIRVYEFIPASFLNDLICFIEKLDGMSYELLLVSDERYKSVINSYIKSKRLQKVFFHNHKDDEFITDDRTYYLNKLISSEEHCGLIKDYYFSVNIPHFTESQEYNTCLNKKVSVDAKGYIKQCPSMNTSYGKIGISKVSEIISSYDFKEVWKVTKNQIETCKVCEYRHVCTDCRAYISNMNNPLSKPAKCSYNPHTLKWEM